MTTRTIETTASEDEAIAYAHQQTQKPLGMIGVPPPTTETEAEFFQRMTAQGTIRPMVDQYTQVKNAEVISSLNSIPPENRDEAQAEIEAVITTHGGAVPIHELTYLWSSNTAAPPRDNSIEVNATDANFAQVTKIFFDDLDAGNVSRLQSLLALKVNTLIRIEHPVHQMNFLQVVTTGAPIERQPADPYIEIPVVFHTRGGSLATYDTQPLTCTFS